jgi:uncharacterized protein
MLITGQRIVITGAASGIGRAIVARLAPYSCRILATDRDAAGLDCLADEVAHAPASVRTYVGDVGNSEGLDALFECALQILGGIDIFIANAGFAYYEQLTEPAWDRLADLYSVNTFSPIYTAVRMRQLNEGRQYRVVVVASAMGLLAIPGYAVYSSSKAALDRFAEAYRLELQDPGALALVYPIGTRTNFFTNAATGGAPRAWPTQSPEQVARAIVAGIERDRLNIYPSLLFRAVILLDRYLPFVRRIEQAIEARRFRRWLSG